MLTAVEKKTNSRVSFGNKIGDIKTISGTATVDSVMTKNL